MAQAGDENLSGRPSDTKSDAKGTARDNVGNHARGTAAEPTGPSGNDKTKQRDDARDQYDTTLEGDTNNR